MSGKETSGREPGDGGFSRRSLLGKAGAATLGLGLAGGAGFGSPGFAQAAAPYHRGYNDGFRNLASEPFWNVIAHGLKVTNGNVTHLRQHIYWSEIQPTRGTDPSTWNWAPLENLRAFAQATNTKVLPHVSDFPEWAKDVAQPCGLFKCKADCLPDYGVFVAELAKFFDQNGTIDSVEVWNEPNYINKPNPPSQPNPTAAHWTMSATNFADLVTHAAVQVDAYRDQGQYGSDITVVSGGLLGFPNVPTATGGCGFVYGWQQYMKDFLDAACGEFAVGIHPYDLEKYETTQPGLTPTQIENSIKNKIMSTVEDALAITNRPNKPVRRVWVTETGCSSRPGIGTAVQAGALTKVADALKTKSRIDAMIVHRFYYVASDDSGPYKNFEVFNPDGTPKQAYTDLATTWGA